MTAERDAYNRRKLRCIGYVVVGGMGAGSAGGGGGRKAGFTCPFGATWG